MAVLILGLLLRLGLAWTLRNSTPAPDAVDEYIPIAQNVLAGIGFVNGAGDPDIIRGPVYPLLIAAAQLISKESLLPLLIFQALLDTLTAWLVIRLTRRLFGESAAFWGAPLYALNPLAIYACGLAVPESLFTCLLTASLVFLLRGLDQRKAWPLAMSGVLLGLATLCRSTPLLLIVPWGLMAWWTIRGVEGLKRAVLLGAACGLVILPWTIRNAVVFHEFIPVVANGGSNLYAGSERAFWAPPPEHHQLRLARYQELIADGRIGPRPTKVGPGAGDKYNASLALANYRRQWQADPWDVVKFCGEKCGRLWYASQSGRGQASIGTINLQLLIMAVCGGLLAWFLRPERRQVIFVLAISVLYFAVVLSALFPQARYVVGFSPFLATLGAPCMPLLWELWRSVLRQMKSVGTVRTAEKKDLVLSGS
jgi:4-amino-4-deoxy-L-arabinose transferase-like glycosyltransferase